MTYFTITKSQVQELIDAYEAYCDEIGQTYYNQEQADIDRTWEEVRRIREELGFPT
jgi:hypothetical protein